MMNCRECSKPVSSKAEACPHCGAKIEKDKIGCARATAIGFTAIVAALLAVTCGGPDKPTKLQDPEKERRFKEEVGALHYLRSNMKNPASFELSSFIRTPQNTLCIVYRGTNSFNAVVTNRHTINDVINSGSDTAWQQYCAGQPGEDVSKAKYALP